MGAGTPGAGAGACCAGGAGSRPRWPPPLQGVIYSRPHLREVSSVWSMWALAALAPLTPLGVWLCCHRDLGAGWSRATLLGDIRPAGPAPPRGRPAQMGPLSNSGVSALAGSSPVHLFNKTVMVVSHQGACCDGPRATGHEGAHSNGLTTAHSHAEPHGPRHISGAAAWSCFYGGRMAVSLGTWWASWPVLWMLFCHRLR